ncbi:AmmeMemoRadiSam system protein B [Candidatus Falkowbacteria bacterium RIFCSPLOWO2_02_FULL_45_15]|uniref:AmmeMemoRadiSam system protein B n=4 Tax=Parcubacteria group TaxID=1794811 RepID=A0A1G1YN60_9BACT|nr:MAG: AmmeMemoRadiSam system protein B [Candidatus Falkowbacteria bacterium RIFCSPHIGHO2_02_FULL_45_15]OGF20159.1 MAG: AmmeMemoRadiSam system protein B [Candidatus Falkowbacteria bacterium RIFCSPLOWO2_02_FULL_45_15]OGY53731.1 MAG: AmmeMemoRadiSam system protein B [Candidatus Buchananbacteria bacterium RIFCSPLOWO2_01_FULL_45_31]
MRRRTNFTIIISGVIGCFFFYFLWLPRPPKPSLPLINELDNFNPPARLAETQNSFYSQEEFLSAVKKAETTGRRSDIYGIIVPHHLVGADIIAELVKMAAGRPINTVIVIGPNHNNIGREPLATALMSWQTPEGNVMPDINLTKLFLTDHQLQPNPSALAKEHSVGVMMPFIKHYWPQAQVLPIVLSSYANKVEAEKLSDWLKSHLNKDVLVIFSLDFSHYLTKEEADLKDEETINLIDNFFIDKIYELNNDYVDSPAGLASALLLAQKIRLKISVVRHSNSFNYVFPKPAATTSYFGVTLTREQ